MQGSLKVQRGPFVGDISLALEVCYTRDFDGALGKDGSGWIYVPVLPKPRASRSVGDMKSTSVNSTSSRRTIRN